MKLSIFDKLNFINETISINGQPVNDDDTVEEVSPDYTGDNPEDEPSKDPNRDAPPKTPDPPPPPEEDTPPADDTPEEGETPATPEEGNETPPDTTPEGDTPPEEEGEDDTPDYTTNSPEGDDTGEETPDAGNDTAVAATADTEPEGNAGGGEAEGTPDTNPGTETPPAEGDTGGEDDAPPDYTADSPEGDDTGDTPTDNAGGGEGTPDANAGGEDDAPPDYTADSPEGDGNEGDAGTEGGEGQDNTNDAEATDAGEGDEIDQLQKDVFADMTPAQIAIKDKEQKTQFITLFSDIASALERLNLVGRNSVNMRTIEFVTRKFLELKDQVKDYLVYTYDNESYTKNTFNLNRFIAIYASLIELIENMVEEKKKLEGETSTRESAFQEFFNFTKDLNQDIGTKYRYARIIHSIE